MCAVYKLASWYFAGWMFVNSGGYESGKWENFSPFSSFNSGIGSLSSRVYTDDQIIYFDCLLIKSSYLGTFLTTNKLIWAIFLAEIEVARNVIRNQSNYLSCFLADYLKQRCYHRLFLWLFSRLYLLTQHNPFHHVAIYSEDKYFAFFIS